MTEEKERRNELAAETRTDAFIHETAGALGFQRALDQLEELHEPQVFTANDYKKKKEVLRKFKKNLKTEWGKGLEQGEIPQNRIDGFINKALFFRWNATRVRKLLNEFKQLKSEFGYKV